ncbi:platelet-activating factor acetylhydrolase [Obelidium mucronatum]|nr:platelet-activating factor acetylhydrolase [Obelidium mucronatum]
MFPPYSGAFKVGIALLEVEPNSPNEYGVFGSLMYPANLVQAPKAQRAKWIPGPPRFYGSGYVNFIGKGGSWFLSMIVSWFIGLFSIPAYTNAPLVSEEQLPNKIPVAVFSHGLVGNQTAYSQLVGTLASHGVVVLSVEHRDGSACASARNNYKTSIPYAKAPPEGPEAVEFRVNQLNQRIQEVNEAYRLLEALNRGDPVHNILGTNLPPLEGRLDLKNSVVIGHSYGGATVLGVLQNEDTPFRCGIALDPWMYPLRSSKPVSVPLLSIQCEKFHWRSNLALFRKIWENSPSSNNYFAVVKDTKHNAVSDFALVIPHFLSGLLHIGKMRVELVHVIYNALFVEFLKKVWIGGLENVAVDDVAAGHVASHVLSQKPAFDHLDAGIEEFERTKGKSY